MKLSKKYGFAYGGEHCSDHVFIKVLEIRKKALESLLLKCPDEVDLLEEYRLLNAYTQSYILNLEGYVRLPF